MASAAEAIEAIRPYIRSSGSAWLRSWSTRVSSTQAPRVPMIAPGRKASSTASTATSATTAPAKARAMPWRAYHMPLRRNQLGRGEALEGDQRQEQRVLAQGRGDGEQHAEDGGQYGRIADRGR